MTLERWTLEVYRALIRTFPREFREMHGADLADATADVVRDTVSRAGLVRLVVLLPRLFLDLTWRLMVEHAVDAWRDGRYAVRMLARAPGFTLAAVLCLSIGTGLTAAMYAQVRATVLAPIPGGVEEPSQLVRVDRPVSFALLREFQSRREQLSAVTGYVGRVPFTIGTDGGDRRRVWGHLVSPEYFQVLGVSPHLGTLFAGADPNGIVLSYNLWQARFDGTPAVIGRSVRLNGQLVTVTGIAPPGFAGPSPMTAAADLWLATTASPSIAGELARVSDDRAEIAEVVGRLRPGVSFGEAETSLEALARQHDEQRGLTRPVGDEPRLRLLPGGRMFPVRTGDLPRAIGFPLVLISLVLVMACGNVGNLLLARSASRVREFAVRLSIGATRSRIFRQMVAESVTLAVLGSAGGVLVTKLLLSAFERLRPVMPEYVQYTVEFHWGAFMAAVAVAAGSTVLFSLVPAVRASRQDIQSALKPNGQMGLSDGRRFGLRNLLVFQQVTISVVLILLTGFVVVGWNRATGVPLGFEPRQLYFVGLDPVRDGLTAGETVPMLSRLVDRVRTTAGVQAVSVAQTVPAAMSGAEAVMSARTEFASGSRTLGRFAVEHVGAGFFETTGTQILRGRAFTPADEGADRRVLIVNGAMAASAWPDGDAVGQHLQLDSGSWEVVGVVEDIRSAFPLALTPPTVFRPATPDGYASPSRQGLVLAVRVAPGIDGVSLLTEVVRGVEPRLTILDVRHLTDEVEQARFLATAATLTYGGMGVIGLLLASVGLAGITSFAVVRRTREIGIRMALGARRGGVLWLVLRTSAIIVGTGIISGLILAVLVTRALASVVETLAEVTGTAVSDPLLLVGGPALLMMLALLACYLPARRATLIDPVKALKTE